MRANCPTCGKLQPVTVVGSDTPIGVCDVCQESVPLTNSPAEAVKDHDGSVLLTQTWSSVLTEATLRTKQEAEELFRDIFGLVHLEQADDVQPVNLGRRTYSSGQIHPDNKAAGKTLNKVIGLYDTASSNAQIVPSIDTPLDDDVVLVGGSASTPFTRIVFEQDGPFDYKLSRSKRPIIPLPYYGLSDPTPIKTDRVGLVIEGVGPVAQYNWACVYTGPSGNKEKMLRSTPGREELNVEQEGRIETVHVPIDNYLIITKLPNFLSSKFEVASERNDRSTWPHVIVFDGMHGVGTRAVELLLREEGFETIEFLNRELHGTTEFQVVFRPKEIQRTDEGFHRAHAIELIDVVPLQLDTKIYQEAHKYAMRRLSRQRRSSWASWLRRQEPSNKAMDTDVW